MHNKKRMFKLREHEDEKTSFDTKDTSKTKTFVEEMLETEVPESVIRASTSETFEE